MDLAIFDLDNTLLCGDSDYLWGHFLVKKQLVDSSYYEEKNQFFYDEYKKGRLVIEDFLAFSLKPLSEIPKAQLDQLHQEFMQTEIIPIITDKAKHLVAKHRDQGDYLLIITATNQFVTEPIAEFFGMNHIIATVPEFKEGQYTGKVFGEPSFQEGKIRRLYDWLETQEIDFEKRYFYSDSINDLPLLEHVDEPIAVDPDEKLNAIAKEKGWEILSLR